MKTKLILVLCIISLAIVAYFSLNKSIEENLEPTPKLAMNFIKCTPATFLLTDVDTTKQISPLFENLGTHSYTISTKNDRAQQFFNQGLRHTYGFNHAEAHRSFMEASRLYPNAAMTFWGQAYVLGPNINDPMPDEDRKNKYNEAIAKAKSLIKNASPKEQALINALTHRYSTDLTKDVAELNMNYMKAMTDVVAKYPNDSDILTLYAASVMNTVPWNYWDNEGNPSPNIKEAKAALEKAIDGNLPDIIRKISKELVRVYNNIAKSYETKHDFDKSLEYFEKCLDACKKADDPEMEAK